MSDFRASIPILDASEERDTTKYCVELEGWFLTSLLGFADVLSLNLAWVGTEEEIAAAVAAVGEQMIALMGVVTCNGVASVRRTRSGYVKAVYQDGTEEIVSSEYTESDLLQFPEDQAVDNNEDNICAGVRMLVDRLMDDIQFSLDQASLMAAGLKTAAEGVSTLLNTITLGGLGVPNILDAWEEFAISSAELGIQTLKVAYADPAVLNKLQENLYCAIVGSGDNLLTEAIYNAATDDLPLLVSQSSLLADFFAGLDSSISLATFSRVLRYYNLGALNEDNSCAEEFECSDGWCYEWDFADGEDSWSITSGFNGAVYGAGIGWVAGNSTDGGVSRTRRADIVRTIASSTLTSIELTYDLEKGTYDAVANAVYVGTNVPSSLLTLASNVAVNGTDLKRTWVTGATGVTQLRLGVISSYDTSSPFVFSGAALIKHVKIKGTGTNPFGVNNCTE